MEDLVVHCPQRCNLKILLIGGKDARSAQLDILPSNPLFIEKKAYVAGVSVISQAYERFLPDAKTLNMLPSYLAHRKAHACGCYDAVFLDDRGGILEGTKTNVFAVRGRELFTSPDDAVLCGITRSIVCRLATRQGFSVRFERIPASKIDRYDGLFLTSTSAKVLPIRTFDGFSYEKIAPAIKEILSSYERFLDECEGVTTNL
jgi:branched-subunit amino acid aminotransferase/4-amino-4-deoxychorismate lyase